jgi:hypothetical protein
MEGAIACLAGIGLLVFGVALGEQSAAEHIAADCENFGAWSYSQQVYECSKKEEVTP